MTAPGELAGKVAIVTGGARRIGRAICLRLAEFGASVVVNAQTAIERAQAVALEIEAMGCGALPILADVTDPAAVRRMVDTTIERFGRIDILVNNAAVRDKGRLVELSLEDWHRVVLTVLDGAFLCSQACAPHLIASEGTIVNIGGASSYAGSRDHPHVMTAKLGLVGLTRSLALDLGPKVVANCLSPGIIDDPGDDEAKRAHRAHGYGTSGGSGPANRSGMVSEIAEGVAMLCSPRCCYMTGQTMHINGGVYFGS
jgi:3-oxoacyl-[acyl-carrier protein] reductase